MCKDARARGVSVVMRSGEENRAIPSKNVMTFGGDMPMVRTVFFHNRLTERIDGRKNVGQPGEGSLPPGEHRGSAWRWHTFSLRFQRLAHPISGKLWEHMSSWLIVGLSQDCGFSCASRGTSFRLPSTFHGSFGSSRGKAMGYPHSPWDHRWDDHESPTCPT